MNRSFFHMNKPIETSWFVDRLSSRQLTQRKLAKLMGLDPAAISLMFRGKRKITLEEAAQLAAILDVTTTEMFERVGLAPATGKQVKLVGFLNGDAEVGFIGKGSHTFVESPGEVSAETIAVQAKTAATKMDAIDGVVYFIDHTKTAPNGLINCLSLCAIKGGKTVIGQIKKGYQRGTYNLNLIGSSAIIENTEIVWASPVTWCKYPN